MTNDAWQSLLANPLERERALLAPYAMNSSESRGRVHDEKEEAYRTAFERDRDRVIHSTAFRRLEYKTQVFVNHEGDHYRTRLTHSLEVAQIARAVARILSLNEALVEAIALSHDLGHSPFGHAGEEKLDELMNYWGGFNHNIHCLRVVEKLEKRYPDYHGLNLSWEIREAIVKHASLEGHELSKRYEPQWKPLLEAQLVDIADSLAYNAHDIDDGLRSGYVTIADFQEVDIWVEAQEIVQKRWPKIDDRCLIARTVSTLIDLQIQDLVEQSCRCLQDNNINSIADVRTASQELIIFSSSMIEKRKQLQAFMRARLYQHHLTRKMSEKGKRFIEALFQEYRRQPLLLPDEFRARLYKGNELDDSKGRDRVICDYIAGMTDRFCQQEFARLFLP